MNKQVTGSLRWLPMVVLGLGLGILLGGALLGSGCDAPGVGNGDGPGDTACSCTVGSKRCTGAQIQVCEATRPECPSWGPASSCPTSACSNSSCGTSCTDTCMGGTTRCLSTTGMEVCRIGQSGCLEWVAQSCPAAQYCGNNSCQPAIACDPACPVGYTCQPNGVCTGGAPGNLTLDVKTVQVSGKVTLNGATPTVGSLCGANPTLNTSVLRFTETTKGYVADLQTFCADSTFSFSGKLYPGTYSVRVSNPNDSRFSNLPVSSTSVSYVANAALVLATDTSALVMDVKTVQVSGKVTLNGATPLVGSLCGANPTLNTAVLRFTETTKGYVVDLNTLCSDKTFSFSGQLYPGTYLVRVSNPNDSRFSNLPVSSTSVSYVVNAALVLTTDTSALVMDVKTVQVSGKVTLNGATPIVGSLCPANPTLSTAVLRFTETTKGYVVDLNTLCSDKTFSFSGQLYPGTYSVRVSNPNDSRFSNLPVSSTSVSYVVNAALVFTADASGLVMDVKTVQVSGKVTLNGATPLVGSLCGANPTLNTAVVRFTETTKGYLIDLSTLCSDSTFSFAGQLYAGTYSVRVSNPNDSRFSNLPVSSTSVSYVANSALSLTANTSGLVMDVKTVQVSGKVTLNGATPIVGSLCGANPTLNTAVVRFTELTKGYLLDLNTLCSDNTFGFSGQLYSGTYAVRVSNPNDSRFSNLPVSSTSVSYVANSALPLAADTNGLVLDVKTVQVSGKVTLNGATPMLGTLCPANPTLNTSVVRFTENTKGYVIDLGSLCADSTFSFSGQVYAGTYAIRVSNPNDDRFSNLPVTSTSVSYKAVTSLQIP